jgi:hypothetical protein
LIEIDVVRQGDDHQSQEQYERRDLTAVVAGSEPLVGRAISSNRKRSTPTPAWSSGISLYNNAIRCPIRARASCSGRRSAEAPVSSRRPATASTPSGMNTLTSPRSTTNSAASLRTDGAARLVRGPSSQLGWASRAARCACWNRCPVRLRTRQRPECRLGGTVRHRGGCFSIGCSGGGRRLVRFAPKPCVDPHQPPPKVEDIPSDAVEFDDATPARGLGGWCRMGFVG